MLIGKQVRIERIINRNTHRTVIVPMDHGVTVGPINGLLNMREAVANMVLGGANAVLMHKGVPRFCHRGEGKDVGLIMHLSAGTTMSPDPNAKVLVCTVEEALKVGADAVSIHINLGASTDKEMLQQFGMVSERCMEWQMPLLAMMYTRGPKIKNEYDVNNIKHAARAAAELGADIVKVSYTGSPKTFEKVTEGCPIPVVIAGGEKMESDDDIFNMVEGALKAGAAGISIGRNIFQHKHPSKMVHALSKMVHDKLTAKEAKKLIKA